MKYKAYSGYARGALHKKRDLPCEDYAVCHEANGCAIAIVSDGHGEALAFRAATGARLACMGTLDILKQYIDESESILHAIENSEERFFFNLQGSILRAWLNSVNADHVAHPFSNDELNALDEKSKQYFSNGSSRSVKAYGCTLIAAYVTPNFWFCLQIGDGSCVASYEDGISVQPLPEGPGQIANITNSLCQFDAMDKFVHYFETKTPLGVFVASDGVIESYKPVETSVQLPFFFREISKPFFHDEQIADEMLARKLKRLTEEGSRDDVSIAAAINMEMFLVEPRLSKDQLQMRLASLGLEIEGKIASIKNNSNALRQVESEQQAKSEDLKKTIAEIERIKRIMIQNKKDLADLLDDKLKIELQLKA